MKDEIGPETAKVQTIPTTKEKETPASTEEASPLSEHGHAGHIPNNEDLPRWRLYLLTFALGVTTMLVALDGSVLGKYQDSLLPTLCSPLPHLPQTSPFQCHEQQSQTCYEQQGAERITSLELLQEAEALL